MERTVEEKLNKNFFPGVKGTWTPEVGLHFSNMVSNAKAEAETGRCRSFVGSIAKTV